MALHIKLIQSYLQAYVHDRNHFKIDMNPATPFSILKHTYSSGYVLFLFVLRSYYKLLMVQLLNR